jgi:hypothetical protein
MGTLVIWSEDFLPSALKVRPVEGTGVTQYRPSGEMGE